MQPIVSVCMPVYNGATFLPRAFASLAAQEFRNFELVIVDDGSTDDSGALAERLIAEHGFIGRVVRTPNRGAEQARDITVAHANTDIIAQCDCDDWWAPTYLSDMMSALSAYPEIDAIYSDMVDIFPDGRQVLKSDVATWVDLSKAIRAGDLYCFHKDQLLQMVLGGHVMYPQCTVYRRCAYERAGPYADGIFNLRISLDWYFSLRLTRVATIAFLKRPLLHRHIHSANTTSDSLQMFASTFAIFQYVISRWSLTSIERKAARRRAATVASWAADSALETSRWQSFKLSAQSFRYHPTAYAIRQAVVATLPHSAYRTLTQQR